MELLALWSSEFGRRESDFGVPRIPGSLAHEYDLLVTYQLVYEYIEPVPPIMPTLLPSSNRDDWSR